MRYLLISLFLFAGLMLTAQPERLFRQVDALFADFDRPDRPGCALAIVRDGEIIYQKGYGMADLEHAVPITPQTVFYAGSVSKQFVAMAILLLQEQGRLSLDDDVRRHVPELPDYGAAITVRRLLHHTSGLRDYLDMWVLSGRDYLDHMPEQAVLDLIFRQRALNFPPGERYSYCNSGYYLLQLIVQRLSGQSLRAFAAEHIFAPLDMTNSHFHDDLHHLIPNRAFGYQLGADRVENLPMRFDLVGSGGLYTTVEDLYKWDQNFYRNRLGKKQAALLDSLHREGRLNDGTPTGYALAQVLGQYRGLPTVGHTGSLGGYRAYYLRFPRQRFSVILLGNFADFTPTTYAQRIADLLLEGAFPEPPPGEKVSSSSSLTLFRVSFSTTELEAAPGRYYSDELEAYARIRRRDDDLILQIGYGDPVSLTEWANRGNGHGIEFTPAGGNAPGGFRLHAGNIKNLEFKRAE